MQPYCGTASAGSRKLRRKRNESRQFPQAIIKSLDDRGRPPKLCSHQLAGAVGKESDGIPLPRPGLSCSTEEERKIRRWVETGGLKSLGSLTIFH